MNIKQQVINAIIAYNNGEPTMTDAEYDHLLELALAQDPQFNPLATIKSTGSKRHSIFMGSLKKTTHQNFPPHIYLEQPKLDGVSVALRYYRGTFVQALSRGNGIVGEDISHIMQATQIPIFLNSRWTGTVRGEAIITLFAHNAHSLGSTARNWVAGQLNRLKPTSRTNLIRFFAYDSTAEHDTEEHMLSELLALGFFIPNMGLSGYQCDGIVYKIRDRTKQTYRPGPTGTPYFTVAYKTPSPQATSTLLSVTFTVGIHGDITPIGHITPTIVGGVTISKASLHNMDVIHQADLAIGDTITIQRAGDVIPQITGATERPTNRQPIIINSCPGCKRTLYQGKCPEPKLCPGVQLKRILVYIKKRNIKYLGPKIVTKLFKEGFLIAIPDIYTLGDEVPNRTLRSINLSKTCSECELIGSLSILSLGQKTAEVLLAYYPVDKWTISNLSTISSIGKQTAVNIIGSIDFDLIKQLKEHLCIN